MNEGVVRALGISRDAIEQTVATQLKELHRREQAYRGHEGTPEIEDKTVILVDDGIADPHQAQREEVVVSVERRHLARVRWRFDAQRRGLRAQREPARGRDCGDELLHGSAGRTPSGTNADTSALLARRSRTMVLLMCACSGAEGRKMVSTSASWRFTSAMLRS